VLLTSYLLARCCRILVFLKQIMFPQNCHFPTFITFLPWYLQKWWIEVSLLFNGTAMYESKYNHHPTVTLTGLTQHDISYLVFNSDSMFASPIRGGMFPSSSTVHRLKKRSKYLSCSTQFPEYHTCVSLHFELPVKGTSLDSMTYFCFVFSKASHGDVSGEWRYSSSCS